MPLMLLEQKAQRGWDVEPKPSHKAGWNSGAFQSQAAFGLTSTYALSNGLPRSWLPHFISDRWR